MRIAPAGFAQYRWLAPAAILLLALLAYANSFPGTFILDDLSIVRDNPLVANPHLSTILTSDYWGVAENSGLYRPVTILSLAANRLLFGPEPWGFHLVNVLLHALVSLLIFLTVEGWLGERPVAWLAAALFAVHPIHTEVVNEVVGRSELLAAGFGLLALWLARRPGRSAAILSLCAVACALLSKEHAVVLLVMLPAADWFFSEGPRRRHRWPYYLALAVIGAGWLVLRIWGVSRQVEPVVKDPFFTPLVFAEPLVRVTTALKLQWQMIGKLILPINLQGVYATAAPDAILLGPASPAGMAVLAASLAVAGLVVRGVLKRQPPALAGGFYLLAILPAANIFFAVGVTFAERLAYFPSVWFCMAVALAMVGMGKLRWKALAPWVAGSLVAVLLVTTWLRNPDFSDPVRLWRSNVATAPRNVMAWMYLGSALQESGRPAEAEAAWRRMLDLAPDFPEGLRTYAQFLLQSGRPAEALPLAEKATRSAKGFSTLSFLLLAEAQYKLNRPDQALKSLDAIDAYYQHYWYYWALRGMVLEASEHREAALACYQKARPWPKQSDLARRAGLLLLAMGRASEAEPILREAVGWNDDAAAWNGLGVALALQGKRTEAIRAFDMAVRLDPASRNYRENLQRAQ